MKDLIMDCKEYKIKLIELAESGALEALPADIQAHERKCAECLAFANTLKAEYAFIRHEKSEPVNPFLADKIIYKMSSRPDANWRTASITRRVALYTATILIGVITGICASYFFMNDTEQNDATSVSIEQSAPVSDDENSVLSLNE